jgi:hypothetical protein
LGGIEIAENNPTICGQMLKGEPRIEGNGLVYRKCPRVAKAQKVPGLKRNSASTSLEE